MDYNPVQGWMDAMSRQWQQERSAEGMTLGRMIDRLAALPVDTFVWGLGDLDSYRGYYSDLAFEPITESRPVVDVLAACRAAMGRTFTGYKGGDYLMGETTPLWVSGYGTASGDRIMDLEATGTNMWQAVTVNEHGDES